MSVRSAAIVLALAAGAWLGKTAPAALAETTSVLVANAGPAGEPCAVTAVATVVAASVAYAGERAQSFYYMLQDMAHDAFGGDPQALAPPSNALD